MAVRIGSTGLNITYLDRSVTFYTRTLGLVEMRRSADGKPRWAHLGTGEDVLLTLWQQAEGAFTRSPVRLHHLFFEVGTGEEPSALEDRFRQLNVPPRGDRGAVAELSRSGQIFFHDPDGIRVELFTDDPAATAPHPWPRRYVASTKTSRDRYESGRPAGLARGGVVDHVARRRTGMDRVLRSPGSPPDSSPVEGRPLRLAGPNPERAALRPLLTVEAA